MRILGILWLVSALCACNALQVRMQANHTRKRSVDFFLDKRKQSTSSSLGDEGQEEGPFLADQATSSSNENSRQSKTKNEVLVHCVFSRFFFQVKS